MKDQDREYRIKIHKEKMTDPIDYLIFRYKVSLYKIGDDGDEYWISSKWTPFKFRIKAVANKLIQSQRNKYYDGLIKTINIGKLNDK